MAIKSSQKLAQPDWSILLSVLLSSQAWRPSGRVHKLSILAETIHEKDQRVKTAENLHKEISPKAKAKVPDVLKAELLRQCRINICGST